MACDWGQSLVALLLWTFRSISYMLFVFCQREVQSCHVTHSEVYPTLLFLFCQRKVQSCHVWLIQSCCLSSVRGKSNHIMCDSFRSISYTVVCLLSEESPIIFSPKLLGARGGTQYHHSLLHTPPNNATHHINALPLLENCSVHLLTSVNMTAVSSLTLPSLLDSYILAMNRVVLLRTDFLIHWSLGFSPTGN